MQMLEDGGYHPISHISISINGIQKSTLIYDDLVLKQNDITFDVYTFCDKSDAPRGGHCVFEWQKIMSTLRCENQLLRPVSDKLTGKKQSHN